MLFLQPQSAEAGLIYRAARVLLGLTLDDIAERTGLSVSLISRVETGRRTITPAVAERLARALTARGR